MALEHREQGETRDQILRLLRRNGPMTAAGLSTVLGIGAVGVRQHLALLENDNLVRIADLRRGVGRPSHLYALTEQAESLFPKHYDRMATDALAFVETLGGAPALDQLFSKRRNQLAEQYAPRLAGKPRAEQVAELALILSDQGYMCEWSQEADGSFTLTEYNCPVDCVAREYPQLCGHELTLYENILGTPIARDETMSNGGTCCRYHIPAPVPEPTVRG